MKNEETTTSLDVMPNENLLDFLKNRSTINKPYRSRFFRMFDYPDGSSSIALGENEEVNIGDDFRDHKGRLHIVTEIIGHRPHKGVFEIEKKRTMVAIVKSQIYPGV